MTDPTPTELGVMHADEWASDTLAEQSKRTWHGVTSALDSNSREYLTAKAARFEKLARALRGEKR